MLSVDTSTNNAPTYKRYQDLIGDTPLIDLTSLCAPKVAGVKLLAKAEFLNPGFSIKDRIMKNIMDDAEASGALRPGMTVVAASSGNTGAATAMMCAMRGYKCIITTNAKCSAEKMDSIKAYGAELIVTPDGVGPDSPDHYMNVPAELLKNEPDKYFDVNQYDNLKNPEAHYKTLGPEIWDQTKGTVTHFVAAGSTGGTISGVGRYLKEKALSEVDRQHPSGEVRIVMADPIGSIFKEYYDKGSHGKAKKFLVEGVGKDTIPGALDLKVVDEMMQVSDKEAFDMCHRLAQVEGLFVGGSSGLNVHAAVVLANSVEAPATIVTVMPDTGIKYLSKVYNREYLEHNHIQIADPKNVDQLQLAAQRATQLAPADASQTGSLKSKL